MKMRSSSKHESNNRLQIHTAQHSRHMKTHPHSHTHKHSSVDVLRFQTYIVAVILSLCLPLPISLSRFAYWIRTRRCVWMRSNKRQTQITFCMYSISKFFSSSFQLDLSNFNQPLFSIYFICFARWFFVWRFSTIAKCSHVAIWFWVRKRWSVQRMRGSIGNTYMFEWMRKSLDILACSENY